MPASVVVVVVNTNNIGVHADLGTSDLTESPRSVSTMRRASRKSIRNVASVVRFAIL